MDFFIEALAGLECVVQLLSIFIRSDRLCPNIRTCAAFLKEVAMLLLLLCIGSVSAQVGCQKSIARVDFFLGLLDPEVPSYWSIGSDEEATEWWTGETDKDGNCLEPHSTFSCNPEDWSNEHRNATLFTCSEKHNLCVDAAYVCNGMIECPNGADEEVSNGEETGLDCSEYECPYPELGGLKCDHGWAEWETKLCLHKGWACDDYQDCASGEDEEDCSGSGSGDYSYYY